MKYLTFPTRADSRSRTGAIAKALGCGKNPGDVTTRWFAVIDHPTNIPQSALVVPEGEEHRLTATERNSLKDRDFMLQQGWDV